MHHRTVGIVLQSIKYGDTSLISKIYTREFGLLSFIIKGIRNAKSRKNASQFQPLRILDLNIRYKENRNLQFLQEFESHVVYKSLPFDIVKSGIALFISEVLVQSVREEEPNATLFDFLENAFKTLDAQSESMAWAPHLFLLQLSPHLGFLPQNNYDETTCYFDLEAGHFSPADGVDRNFLNPQESALLSDLLKTRVQHFHCETNASTEERRTLLNELVKYYRLHLESFQPLKSLEVLEAVFH